MNISIIGVGYVGLVTGTCFAELGNHVLCMDIDEAKINQLIEGRVPFYEPQLEELIKSNYSLGRLDFTSNIEECVKFGELVFITVGTPEGKNKSPDMHYINEVINEIIPLLEDKHQIVVKSTVPIGSSREIKERVDEEIKKYNIEAEIELAFNPEFLSEGTAVSDFMFPDRIVLGVETTPIKNKLLQLYGNFIEENIPVLITKYETAEMIKYASNAFLATKISYINEIAAICEYYGANIKEVADGVGLDRRIGNNFLRAGAGYGGSCFPKDTRALYSLGARAGHKPQIVKAAINVNDNQKYIIIKKVKKLLGDFEDKTVGILGVAFKPGTDDIREAPASPVIDYLIRKKVKVKIYDPKAMENFKNLHSEVQCCENEYEACENCDCIIVFTEWQEFLKLDFDYLRKIVNKPVLLDLRNMFDPIKVREHGFSYLGVGIV